MMKRILKYTAVIFGSLVISAYIQSSGNFPDPDSFYHAGIVSLLRDGGIVKDFPWLQFTSLKENYVDHHLLYHLFATPLSGQFNSLAVLRGLSFVFAALFMALFFYIQERRKMRAALISTIILAASSTFLFRINLAKGVAPVLIIFLLLVWSIIERRQKTAFVLSVIYPWAYAGWPIALALPLINMVAAGASACTTSIKSFLAAAMERTNVKLLLIISLGTFLGLITNPYFPDNLWFTWMQAVKIGLINYQGRIAVGQEWYPVGYGEILGGLALLIIFFLVSAVLFFGAIQKKDSLAGEFGKKMAKETMFLLSLAGIFFVLTIKSRRSAEYFIPLALLASSWLLEAAVLARPRISFELRAFFKKTFWRKVVIVYIIFSAVFIIVRDIRMVKIYFDRGFSPTIYRSAALVAASNLAPGDIVFNAAWDEFPMLFYWNKNQYYISGLDPTFFYEFNRDLYDDWFETINGRFGGDVANLISAKFRAKAVFVSSRYGKFRALLKEDERFELIYDDQTSTVFKIR